jgi:hypothetical protein
MSPIASSCSISASGSTRARRRRCSRTPPSPTFMWEPSVLSVDGLEVRYGAYITISGVSLSVAAGEVVCLMGHNGSGKSSLMNAASGLIRPHSGSISFAGERIDETPTPRLLERGLAHVLERRRLFPYAEYPAVVEDLAPRLHSRKRPRGHGRRSSGLARRRAFAPDLPGFAAGRSAGARGGCPSLKVLGPGHQCSASGNAWRRKRPQRER